MSQSGSKRRKDKGKLVPFPGCTKPEQGPDAQPQEEVIDLLTDLLEQAERGEIQAIAVGAARFDGETHSSYALGTGFTRHTVVAALEYAKQILVADDE